MRFAFLLLLLPLLGREARAQSCSEDVCVEASELRNRVDLFARNDREDTVRVTFSFDLQNMHLDRAEPVAVVVPPGGRVRAATLEPRDRQAAWRWRYRFRWQTEGTEVMDTRGAPVRLTLRHVEGETHYTLGNTSPVPLMVTYAFLAPGQPYAPGQASEQIALEPGEARSVGTRPRTVPPWSLRFGYAAGRPGAPVDTAHVYALPVGGAALALVQHGEAAHLFEVPRGAAVRAVRTGVVLDALPGTHVAATIASRTTLFQTRPAEGVRRRPARGFVSLYHDDGTVSTYEGLDGASVPVAVGQRVGEGALLGRAGHATDQPLPEAGSVGGTFRRTEVRALETGAPLPPEGDPAPDEAPALLLVQVYRLGARAQPVPVAPLRFHTAGGVQALHVGATYTAPAHD